MKSRTWIILLSAVVVTILVLCGLTFTMFYWLLDGSDSEFAFGEGIAIIRVDGVILPGYAPDPGPFSAEVNGAFSGTLISQLKDAEEDSDVKAIILHIDSPGGSVYASAEIHHQLEQMEKPILVSMESLAASGGYYISAPATEIWAAQSTLTCSIGVISQFMNFSGFAEEYGITAVTVKSGKFKDVGNAFREFTEDDRNLWQDIIDESYNEFVRIVAEGRGMSETRVREIADGRICTGQQAYEAGLVDGLGYLPDVIDRAAELAGIEDEDPRIIRYADSGSILDFSATVQSPSPVDELQELLNYHAGSPLMYLYIP